MTDMTARAAVEDKKTAAGRTATLLWVGTGIYYFAMRPQASVLSWQSMALFVIGMFVAALVFGASSHYLFAAQHRFDLDHARGAPPLLAIAAFLMIALNLFEIGAPIMAARWVFLRVYGLD